jgi:hypothetical protein
MKLEITTEQLRPYSIMVGCPMYGGQATGMFTKATNDLSMLCTAAGIKLKYYFLFNESLVQRARNYIVDEFIRSDFTHLMFIDSDIGFDARDVLALLGIQTQDPEKYDIMTGPYPKKTIAWEKVSKAAASGVAANNPFELDRYTSDFVFNPVQGLSSFNLGEPIEVREAGTGFMLIPRTVLDRFKKAYPELAYLPDHARTENFDGSREIHAYFDCIIDPETRRYLSEDYFFCRKARDAGMSVWMCPWMKLNHIGSYIFKGDMGAIGSIGVSATADQSSKKKNYGNNKQKSLLTNQKKRNRMK